MNNQNVKERDVMSFDNFAKAYDKAKDVIPLAAGKDAHPQTHKIKAEGLFARHDANVYRAAGIPIDEKEANASDRVIPGNENHPQPKPHDGQDPLPGAKLVKGQDVNANSKEEKAEEKAAKTYAAASDKASEEIKKK